MRRSFQECLEVLQRISVRGYGKQLPGQFDEVFTEFAKMYIAAQAADRSVMRESIPDSCLLAIIGFSDRFAMLAERGKSVEFLKIGYAAHAIEGFRYDQRENFLRLSLLAHVARKLSLAPSELIDWASSLGSDEARDCFARFKDRPEEINTIETMGIKESITPDGILYEYVL